MSQVTDLSPGPAPLSIYKLFSNTCLSGERTQDVFRDGESGKFLSVLWMTNTQSLLHIPALSAAKCWGSISFPGPLKVGTLSADSEPHIPSMHLESPLAALVQGLLGPLVICSRFLIWGKKKKP